MALSDFEGGHIAPLLSRSIDESEFFGLSVGRMSVPVGFLGPVEQIRDIITSSKFDVVFVRAPSYLDTLIFALNSPPVRAFQVDSLLYFSQGSENSEIGAGGHLRRLSRDEESQCREAITAMFADYRNHYSANPALKGFPVPEVYARWASQCLDSSACRVDVVEEDGQVAALAVTQTSAAHLEVLLAGVVPAFRGRGHYQSLLRGLMCCARTQGKEFVISTQSSNIKALRAWCKVGLIPRLALNTFHAVSEERGPLGVSRLDLDPRLDALGGEDNL